VNAPTHNRRRRWRDDDTSSTVPGFDPLFEAVIVGLDMLSTPVLVRCKELEMDEESPSTVYTRT